MSASGGNWLRPFTTTALLLVRSAPGDHTAETPPATDALMPPVAVHA